ncbi:hypothetical protein Aph01nite_51480 [Acrocarpospora phusangensis]|uniref:Secreted protein n=1 Tax=Acrocarpospora phusangensis TaxID=1070424 RepID=A0A919UQW4_9ACTN|nr:hypothetical protein [Acrocarpospora phusangensis]GIH26838.1 hypothetical protein Aph01nite_51480 [Acrocarpospora phusangensis]
MTIKHSVRTAVISAVTAGSLMITGVSPALADAGLPGLPGLPGTNAKANCGILTCDVIFSRDFTRYLKDLSGDVTYIAGAVCGGIAVAATPLAGGVCVLAVAAKYAMIAPVLKYAAHTNRCLKLRWPIPSPELMWAEYTGGGDCFDN